MDVSVKHSWVYPACLNDIHVFSSADLSKKLDYMDVRL